ncbi:MAG: ornithine carbamoyltransferase [Rhodospirillaceae bacterium]|nr:ornithine carbamoyltransferase [Rhodospirillaceae bacterium]
MTARTRHFLDLDAIDAAELRVIIDAAAAMKRGESGLNKPLEGKFLAMIFEKQSTRTRVSFEVAMKQLGGEVVVLNSNDLQLGRGESVADTARVLSRYVDCIMMRTYGSERIAEMADYASVPVINGLTDSTPPCQLMADVLAFEEHRGPIKGRTVAWSGDGNNMAASWIHASVKFGFKLKIATPPELSPDPALLTWADKNGGSVELMHDPRAAVAGADCVVTDAWVSMGDNEASRHNMLAPFRVDATLMGAAKENVVFLHCLPAHRGEEVTADVIDGPQSLVWDEAENRLHSQKAILAWCLQ